MSDIAVDLHPQFLVDEQGERHAVQLSMVEYDALMEIVEDYLAGQALDRAVANSEGLVDFEDVLARMKAKGEL